VSEVDKLNLCEDCKEKILERLYYICATYLSIEGRKNTYKEVCKVIYDITGNENYNPDNPNWEEEPNELIRITELLKNKDK